MNVVRTTTGWQFNEDTHLPFGFNPQKDLDPIALHYLEEAYGNPEADTEILSFRQKGTVIFTPTHQVPITKSGLYLMRTRHIESDCDYIDFVRVLWLDELYRGTRREPYVHIEHTIELRLTYGEDCDREANMVRDAFEKAIELF